MVIGMGERKTPKPFSVACNVFKYLDILTENEAAAGRAVHVGVKESEPESMTNIDTILRACPISSPKTAMRNGASASASWATTSLSAIRFLTAQLRLYQASQILSAFDQMKLTKVNSSVYVTIKAPHSDLRP